MYRNGTNRVLQYIYLTKHVFGVLEFRMGWYVYFFNKKIAKTTIVVVVLHRSTDTQVLSFGEVPCDLRLSLSLSAGPQQQQVEARLDEKRWGHCSAVC